MLEEALKPRRQTPGKEHVEAAPSRHNLAEVLRRKSDESLLREALTMQRKLLGQEYPEVAESLNRSCCAKRATLGRLSRAPRGAGDIS